MNIDEELKRYSPQQQAFFHALFSKETMGNPRKAMDIAGYSKSTSLNDVTKGMADILIEGAKQYMQTAAPLAAMKLVDTVENPVTPGAETALKAITQLMDRIGVVKVDKIEHTVNTNQAILVLPAKTED